MARFFILFLMASSYNISRSQNLVINPGIDGYIVCPGFGQFSNAYIISWNKPTIGSSDYYNYNCPGIQPTIQAPHSGEGYAGIICYNFGTEYREYITGTFSSPLVAGTTYDVEFYVNLHNGYIQAIEEVGAYISNTAPGPFANALHINVVPQIENNSGALNDTVNWKRIYGQYLAAGGEQFITIGNFYDDAGTTITQPGSTGSFGAYYFVDDVSVIADSTTSIIETSHTTQPAINVIQGNLLEVSMPPYSSWQTPGKCIITDASGKRVITSALNKEITQIELMQLSGGLYIATIESKTGEKFSKKFVFMSGAE